MFNESFLISVVSCSAFIRQIFHTLPSKLFVTSFTSSLFIISCHYPVEPDVKLGALYSIDKMPDHHGSLFDHKKSKLVQLPIYDIDNKLIPMFQFSHHLRVRTIIMAKYSLQCYIISKNYNEQKVILYSYHRSHFQNLNIYRHIN